MTPTNRYKWFSAGFKTTNLQADRGSKAGMNSLFQVYQFLEVLVITSPYFLKGLELAVIAEIPSPRHHKENYLRFIIQLTPSENE